MKARTLAVLAGVVLALSGLTACATGSSSDYDELDLAQLLEEASEYQKDIISDGDVNSAEYERALLALRECVTEAGAIPGEIYEIGNNELTFDYEVFAENDAARVKVEELSEACRPAYFEQVGQLWAYQQLLTPEERDQAKPRVLACLEKAGLTDISDDAGPDAIVAAIRNDDEVSDAEQACINANVAFFSTWSNEHSSDH